MEEKLSVRDTMENIAVRFVAAAESDLAERDRDPFSWCSVTVSAPLNIDGVDVDCFYVDYDGYDHPLALGFDADLYAVGCDLDGESVSILVRVQNTLDATGEYEITVELGYRTETGVLEYVSAPTVRSRQSGGSA